MNTKNIIAGIAAVGIISGATAAYSLLVSPFSGSEETYVCIDSDDTMDSVRTKVSDAGNASQMLGFRLMSLLKGYSTPRTGRYAITPGMNHFNLVRNMANGHQAPIHLAVPEVRTVEAMAERLSDKLMVSKDELMELLTDNDYLQSLGGYTKETAPCIFIPNTYDVYWNVSATSLLERLHKEAKTFWNDERLALAKQIGYTPEEVVTIASIVESETSYGPEKSTIAGLYIHRLHTGMPLQSDPTVIFAIGDFGIHRVTKAQTQYDSPYNTYVYSGLPPGPIRIPSIAGIDAVLHYEPNTYLYMCAKEDFSGSHNFTSNYAEHMQNARRYQRALNERGIRK